MTSSWKSSFIFMVFIIGKWYDLVIYSFYCIEESDVRQ